MSPRRVSPVTGIHRHVIFAALTAIALTGCKSADEKREDLVKCFGFSLGLTNASPTSPLVKATDAALNREGITGNDTMPMGAAAQRYSSAMNPAKAYRLSREGSATAADLIRKNDADGIAGFLKDCVATYKDLGQ